MTGHVTKRRITALKVQQRNPQRINIFLDDEFAFGLSRITAAWLHVGQELSDEKIAQLKAEDEGEVAYQRALRQLDRRPRSESEIRRKLQIHHTPDEVIEETLVRLRHNGLVNDDQFANQWVENQTEFRPRSRRALAYEMRQRGLSSTSIDQALEQITPEDEEELAYQAASKQARKLKDLDWAEYRQKMAGYLARRGFSYEISAPVIQRTWRECTSQQDLNGDGTPDSPNEINPSSTDKI
jgi:regulatory protein